MSSEYRIQFDKMAWVEPQKGVRYKSIQQDGRQIRIIEFSRGMKHESWCRIGHVGYIISGELNVHFEHKTIKYSPGDALYIPDGVDHKHRPEPVSETVTLFSVERLGE